jgi:hypothetical protein
VACRDKVTEENNSRNAAVRKVMAALYILRKHPRSFDTPPPLKGLMHYREHDDCTRLLARSGKGVEPWTQEVNDTAAQMFTFHYWVRCTPLWGACVSSAAAFLVSFCDLAP